MKRLLSVLLTVILLLSALPAGAQPAESEAVATMISAIREAYGAPAAPQEGTSLLTVNSAEAVTVPLYYINASILAEDTVYFFNGNKAVAYQEVSGLFDFLEEMSAAISPGYELGGFYGEDYYLAQRENGEFVLVDFANGMLFFSDYDKFGRSASAVSGGDLLTTAAWQLAQDGSIKADADGTPLVNLFSRQDNERNFTRYGYSLAVPLAELHIPIYWYKGKGYMPVTTFTDLFMTLSYVYNGEALFLIGKTGFDDAVPNASGQTLWDIASNGPRERSAELAEYTYWELVMMLEGNYGLREEHQIGDDFDEYFSAIGLKERLLSQDGTVFSDALSELFFGYFADLHSALTTGSPFAGPDYVVDYKTRPNISATIKASLASNERYTAARAATACVDESGEVIPYMEIGNTAYVTFDGFALQSQLDYYNPDIQAILPQMIPADNVALLHYANEQINRNDSPIENVVIDLSLNGGGLADAAIYTVSWVLGTCQFSTVNPRSKAQYTVGYHSDVDLDGHVTEKDHLDLSRLKVYCLISDNSFSCGNFVPAAFKESGLVTLLGRRSGGGACVVDHGIAADGTAYQYSCRYRLSTLKNGSYYSIDQGVDPDFVISDPAHLYDREWLTDYINQLP